MAFKLGTSGFKSGVGAIGKVSATRGLAGGGGLTSNIQILGVPEAIAKLQLVASYTALQTGAITLRSAQRIESQAKQNVHSSSNPYDGEYDYTDDLRNSIGIGKSGLYSWEIFADSDHAAFEELGTYRTPAHPFLRPALYSEIPVAQGELVRLAKEIEAL